MHFENITYNVGKTEGFSKQTEKSYKEGTSILYFSVNKSMKYCPSSSKGNHFPIKHKTYFKDLNLIAYCTSERDYELNWTLTYSRLLGQQPPFHLVFSIQYCRARFPCLTPASMEVCVCLEINHHAIIFAWLCREFWRFFGCTLYFWCQSICLITSKLPQHMLLNHAQRDTHSGTPGCFPIYF